METLIQWITRQGLPCLFQLITGLYCPGCGGTRAGEGAASWESEDEFSVSSLILYAVLVLTVELISFALSRALKNPRWYLGHETLFVYIAAGIIVVNWICKNVLLVFFGIDLLPAWG